MRRFLGERGGGVWWREIRNKKFSSLQKARRIKQKVMLVGKGLDEYTLFNFAKNFGRWFASSFLFPLTSCYSRCTLCGVK